MPDIPIYMIIIILIILFFLFLYLKERIYFSRIEKALSGIEANMDLVENIYNKSSFSRASIYKGLEISFGELKSIKLSQISINGKKKSSIKFYKKLIEFKNKGFLNVKLKIEINGRSSLFLDLEEIKADIKFKGNIIHLGKIKLIECEKFKLKGKYDFLQYDIIDKINNGALKIKFLDNKKVDFNIDFIESKLFDLEEIPGNLTINLGKKVKSMTIDKINEIKIRNIKGKLTVKGDKEYSILLKEKVEKGEIIVEEFIIK